MFAFMCFVVFFFKQKTAYEMRISDWSSDVCSSDLAGDSVGRDTIYTQLDRKAAPESFVTTALRLCGDKPYCKFMGWTNPVLKPDSDAMKIGRASCRERVCQYV